MQKRALVAIGLLGVAAVVAHLYVQSQVYYPVVRLSMPDGLNVTALLPETKERKACGVANDNFVTPFKQTCKECKVMAARCERELEGLELAMQRGDALAYPMVVAPRQLKIVIAGPPETAKVGCEFVAKGMVAKGVTTAACIPARLPPAKS